MQVVVLAAGAGTRLRPLTDTVPKPMLPVGDAPMVAHVADAAVEAGASELVFVVGYGGERVREYFGDSFEGVPVAFAEQSELDGTASAVRAAVPHLGDEPFAVLNGDNCYDTTDLRTLFEAGPAVGVRRVDDPSNYGVVTATDGAVTDVIEKPSDPPSNLANVGAYVFPASTVDRLDVPVSRRGERELTDVLARIADERTVTPVEFGRWLDVGRPWELLEANERALAELSRDVRGDVSEDATLRGPVVVEEGARIEPGVVVDGPALIQSGATVGPNAYVRGATLIGEDAKVGHAVEVKNSVLMHGATVGHLSYVGDSLLGRDVNFGAGTDVANLRHDDRPVRVTVKGDRVSTGRRKFGTVVGHGAKTGIDTAIDPGVVIASGETTRPGEHVSRDRGGE